MTSLVNLKVENHIGFIQFNRPEAANAMSIRFLTELSNILKKIHFRRDIRVVIISGAGDRAFCAGADLKERKSMNEIQVREAVSLIGSTIKQIEDLPQPVIAVLNGVAFGGGLELALACDLRIAAEHAKMGLTETSLGIIPGAGGTQRLPRLIGIGKAKELIYSARRIKASIAYDLGIVEHVYPSDVVMEKAIELALEIASNAPLSLIQAKTAINSGLEVDLNTGLKIEELSYNQLLQTNDRLEGLRAFEDKRQPQYQGN